jgi:hypothetical protein
MNKKDLNPKDRAKLEEILTKLPYELTDYDRQILLARRDYLNNTQRKMYKLDKLKTTDNNQ